MNLPRSPRLFLPLCTLIPFFLFIWNSLYFSPWIVDDAFISLRYARNLVEGNGLVYNPGERVEGFSNFTWVLLAAALFRLHAPLISSLKLVGIISGVSVLLLSYFLARTLGDRQDKPALGILVLWYLACNTSLAIWSQGGLETTFHTALILAAALQFEKELREHSAIPWSALLFSVAWMTRPETPAYLLYFIIRRLSVGASPRRHDYRWLAAFLGVILPYEVWGYYYFETILPNTYAAKVGSISSIDFKDLVAFCFRQGWGFSSLAAISVGALAVKKKRIPIVIWAPLVSGLCFVLLSSPDWMPAYRFFIPVNCFLACMIAKGILEVVHGFSDRALRRAVAVCGTAFLALAYAKEQFSGSFQHSQGKPLARAERGWEWWKEVPSSVGQREWPLEMTALVFLAHTRIEDRIAIKDFGFPGFISKNSVWDLSGLVTPAAATLRQAGEGREVRREYINEFLQSGGASYIFIPRVAWPHIVFQEQIIGTRFMLEDAYLRVDQGSVEDDGMPRFERLLLGLPPGCVRVWRRRDLTTRTREEILANLESRLAIAVQGFPEYERRGAELLGKFRQYLEKLAEEG